MSLLSLLKNRNKFHFTTKLRAGSAAGIMSICELDGSGSNPGGDEIFRPSRPVLGSLILL